MAKRISKKEKSLAAAVEGIKKIVTDNGYKEGDMIVYDVEPIPIQDVCVDAAVIDENGVLRFGDCNNGVWTFFRDETNTKHYCMEDTFKEMSKHLARKKAKS